MGLYDTLQLPAELLLPGLDRDPSTITWQTKSIGMPAMRTFRITPDGRLLQEESHAVDVPEEERPHYGTDKWEKPMFRLASAVRHVHDGWSERQYHGVIRFVASVDDERFEYQAKFTDGRLVAVRQDDEGREWILTKTSGPDSRSAGDRRGVAGIESGVETESASTVFEAGSYKLTARKSLADVARIYDVSISEDALADASPDERYLQLLHLPDDRGRVDASPDMTIPRGCVYELAIREPRTIEERDGSPQLISRIIEREGPFELETALRRVVDLAESANYPVHSELTSSPP